MGILWHFDFDDHSLIFKKNWLFKNILWNKWVVNCKFSILYCSFKVAHSIIIYLLEIVVLPQKCSTSVPLFGRKKQVKNASYTVTTFLELKIPPLCKVCRVMWGKSRYKLWMNQIISSKCCHDSEFVESGVISIECDRSTVIAQ